MDFKNSVIVLALVALVIECIRYRREVIRPLVVACVVALCWTSYYPYHYIGGNVVLFNRINTFPLVLWIAGLTSLHLLHQRVIQRYGTAGYLITALVYFGGLALLEFVGYHLLNIQLDSNFTSLFNLGILHGPPVMKVFYLSIGPLYLLFLQFLEGRYSR